MGIIQIMNDKVVDGIRNWLRINPAPHRSLDITPLNDHDTEACTNLIWYRGDSYELRELYSQRVEYSDTYKFWSCMQTPGMEIRRIHTGLPGLMVRILTGITMSDIDDITFDEECEKEGKECGANEETWKAIAKDNVFYKTLENAIRETLIMGDGAFKISTDPTITDMPIIEWYPSDRVDFVRKRGRLVEIVFKTPIYIHSVKQSFLLLEHYGKGYITSEVVNEHGDNIDRSFYDETRDIPAGWTFPADVMLAAPMMVYSSGKHPGRGGSIYDGKLDSFDALDEVWSQWMDALRAGRTHTYIPEALVRKDPDSGETMKPNPFDNRFIMTASDMSEGANMHVQSEQSEIASDSYIQAYTSALDLCLEGILSPSTLGIDVKKLDNAEAQREKEKVTMYTRQEIITAIQDTVPALVKAAISCYHLMRSEEIPECKCNVVFGEYANPSFEATVETVGKAKTAGIMSLEACVDELYGDTRNDDWKEGEVRRLMNEQGIIDMEEVSVTDDADNMDDDSEGDSAEDDTKDGMEEDKAPSEPILAEQHQ